MRCFSVRGYLTLAQAYADALSGCEKVKVGCILVKNNHILGLGANRAIPDLCQFCGCLRVEKYGDDSKSHRNPGDCRAIHSEIDALCDAAFKGTSVAGGTAFVTRYPCEACARALISAGISCIYYGGTAKVSSQTLEMLEQEGVDCFHIEDWRADFTDR